MSDLNFDMPQNQSSSIKVIGVGGGGSNAVNYMYHKGIKGVDFVVCNTDQQALDDSPVPTKIQLGVSVTEGLGAGAWPLKGRLAAEENIKDVVDVLECNTKMVFINAGMGGGTGTGAAPVIAKAAKDLDILTVAIVTIPFIFEGEQRMNQAKEGIQELKPHVDSLIVINNNKLREIYGNLGFKSGFAKADEILATASRGIAEVITQKGHLNIDLNDAKTVLSNSGTAIMGSGSALGDGRAIKAVKAAIESPLLDNNHIRGAKKVLLLIVSGIEEVTFEEMGEISDFIQDQVMLEGGTAADIIMGVAEDETLESSINVTVVATGFHEGNMVNPLTGSPDKVVHPLDGDLKPNDNQSIDLDENIGKSNSESTIKVTHLLNEEEEEHIEENSIEDKSQISQINSEVDESEVDDQQQVSMTFEFDVEKKNEVIIPKKRQEPKIVFDLIEEIEEERLETAPKDLNETTTETSSDLSEKSFELNSDQEIIDENVAKSKVLEEERNILDTEEIDTSEDRIEKSNTHDSLLNDDEESIDTKESSLTDGQEVQDQFTVNSSTKSKLVQEQIERAKKRKERLHKFNYMFRNNAAIEDAEKEPAYKRQGIDLNDTNHSSESIVSNISLELDEDGELKLNSKNSFLHDNVD